MQSYTTLNLLEVLVVFLATCFGSYTDQPEDGSVYELKRVARNTTNTSNKLRVVYDNIILQFYIKYIDHIKHNGNASL